MVLDGGSACGCCTFKEEVLHFELETFEVYYKTKNMSWNLKSKGELKKLDEHLLHHSYVSGFLPSADDVAVFNQIAAGDIDESIPNVARWFNHIASFSPKAKGKWAGAKKGAAPAAKPAAAKGGKGKPEKKEEKKEEEPASPKSPKETKPAKSPAKSPAKGASPKAKAVLGDDDDFGFSDDDDEEGGPSAEELIAAKNSQKKEDKPKGGKSSVILDVKPWGLETDMAELERSVRAIEVPGLRWAGSQLEKVAYGVMMLRINAVVEDELVSIDELQESIEALEEHVQSTDIYAFNKL
jgi:elongation factor 1-beta